jgi:RND family efflux transporter MFP subunit
MTQSLSIVSFNSRRLFLASLLVVAAMTISSCGGKAAPAGPPAGGGMPVKVLAAKSEAVNDSSDYVATLKSRDSAVVMPEVEGRITQIYVHSGAHVTAGTPLMQIDPSKQQATVNSNVQNRSAQIASLQYAKQQYDRTSSLAAAGVVSKQELDQAKSALDAAQAQLGSLDAQVQQQQVQLRYYRVVAPSSGVVGDIPVRVGDRVVTSTMLTTVDKPGGLEAYIYVPIEKSGQLKLNMPVQIVDADGKVMADSRISFISPEVDNTTQSVLAKAKISNTNDNLRTAQFIRARVIWKTQQSPVVPVLAVSRIGGQYFVFVAEDQGGKTFAHQRALQIGDMVGNDYAVISGIKAGEKVIVSGTEFLVDGMPVIPQA